MTMLQKFIEQGPYGEKSGRIGYAFKSNSLPQPQDGMNWQIRPRSMLPTNCSSARASRRFSKLQLIRGMPL
jgi:hypothetical protein